MATKHSSIRFDEQVLKLIDKEAKDRDRSRSYIVNDTFKKKYELIGDS